MAVRRIRKPGAGRDVPRPAAGLDAGTRTDRATRILVVGGGGREHALGLALAGAEPRPDLVFAPGNPGTAGLGRNVGIDVADAEGLARLAEDEAVDLVIPGPEAPLVAGLADRLAESRIPCAGPVRDCARLEGSKAFTRELARAVGVPGPRFRVVKGEAQLDEALAAFEAPPVVKADGLAAGKGVVLPETMGGCREEALAMLRGRFGAAGRTVVLEERLFGREASLFYACHGTRAIELPTALDHKRLHDGDLGPNTGGMGAVSPHPDLGSTERQLIKRTLVDPVLAELAIRGTPYRGFLYVGVMRTALGPRLLEFNVRLGDPEAQVILPRLPGSTFLALALFAARGGRPPAAVEDPACAVSIVLAAPGYPEAPRSGTRVKVDPALAGPARWLIHAGTRADEDDGSLTTAGGRVAAVVARAPGLEAARALAYQGVELVRFEGMQYRRDVGGPPVDPPVPLAAVAGPTAAPVAVLPDPDPTGGGPLS